jgi:hypothetical protein
MACDNHGADFGTAIAVALIAGISGVSGAFLGGWIVARESKADREEARRARFADRTLELAGQVLDDAFRFHRVVADQFGWRKTNRGSPLPPADLDERYGRGVRELRMVMRQTRARAALADLDTSVRSVGTFRYPTVANVPGPTDDDLIAWRAAQEGFERAADVFERAVTAELGVQPDHD